jgi:hypothetical protein
MADNSQAVTKSIRKALEWYREPKWEDAKYASNVKQLVHDFAKDLVCSKLGGCWPMERKDKCLIYDIMGGIVFTFPSPVFMPKPVKNVSTARWQLMDSSLVLWDPTLFSDLVCPHCGSRHVTGNGWDYNPRVIKDIQGDLYLVSHQSRCSDCKKFFKDSIPEVVNKLPQWARQQLPYLLTKW